ncbi:MAG: site-2 protease family protein [Methylococcales bacterium]|nr:site-2 protease family protein [Methylococcales bacterium]
MMNELTIIQRIFLSVIPLVFAITVHEVAHGWVAKKYGDNTAYILGRLTLNPFKHIDLIGTIIIPGLLLITKTGFIFGWAKPVPVDTRYFKKPRHDMAIVALAGPISNLLMAIGWVLIARMGVTIFNGNEALMYIGLSGAEINLQLMLLNLIPIPPLDGARVFSGMLPSYWAWQFNKLERFGFVILLILLNTKALNFIFDYPKYIIENWYYSLVGL